MERDRTNVSAFIGLACAAAVCGGVLGSASEAEGQVLRQRLIGTPLDERFNGATAIAPSGFIAVGAIVSAAQDTNMLVTRLDAQGNVMWAQTMGTPVYDEAFSVVATQDGNFVIAGLSASLPTSSIVVLKMTPAGGLLWAQRFFGNGLADIVAQFHPVVIESPQANLFVIGHHLPNPTVLNQFGRLFAVRPNGTVVFDTIFLPPGANAMISPSDLRIVSSVAGTPEIAAICGTRRQTSPNGTLRSGIVTLHQFGAGFFATNQYAKIALPNGGIEDSSFRSIAGRPQDSQVFINGSAGTGTPLPRALLLSVLTGAAVPPIWALQFNQVDAAQAGMRMSSPQTLVWTGTHQTTAGVRTAQMQSTQVNLVQNWHYLYPWTGGTNGNALVIDAVSGMNHVFGESANPNFGYGGADGLFVRADANGTLGAPNGQCPQRPLPAGEPQSMTVAAIQLTATQVEPPQPWQFTRMAIQLRDERVCLSQIPLPCCIADVASDALDVVYNPNGVIGAEDLDAFIAGFIANNVLIADVASDSLDTTCNPNGAVGAEDLDAFIASFISGVCP